MMHIILIGFKHVGKTTIGKVLATRLELPFADMDDEIEAAYARETGRTRTCREIMREIGKSAFRDLESGLFAGILNRPERHVIATGGGLALNKDDATVCARHIVIHIECDKDMVFERITRSGKPAFFSDDRPVRESFDELWDMRMPIFRACATHAVKARQSIEETVSDILQIL